MGRGWGWGGEGEAGWNGDEMPFCAENSLIVSFTTSIRCTFLFALLEL